MNIHFSQIVILIMLFSNHTFLQKQPYQKIRMRRL